MKKLWKVWFSKRRHLYIEIARKHGQHRGGCTIWDMVAEERH